MEPLRVEDLPDKDVREHVAAKRDLWVQSPPITREPPTPELKRLHAPGVPYGSLTLICQRCENWPGLALEFSATYSQTERSDVVDSLSDTGDFDVMLEPLFYPNVWLIDSRPAPVTVDFGLHVDARNLAMYYPPGGGPGILRDKRGIEVKPAFQFDPASLSEAFHDSRLKGTYSVRCEHCRRANISSRASLLESATTRIVAAGMRTISLQRLRQYL